MEFKDKLKYLRKQKGLSQELLCKELYISRGGYMAYERGKTEPNRITLLRMAEVFDKSLDYIMRDE